MHRVVSWFLPFALLGGIIFTQVQSDTHRPTPSLRLFTTYSAPLLRVVDLGLHSATASLLWIGVIQNIGTQGSFLGLAHSIETINALDPRFSYPYAFGVLIIPMMDKEETSEALAIGKRGVAQNLNDWHIPYYLATTYHLVIKDSLEAARYFAVTAHTKGVPDGIKGVALGYATRADLREKTKAIWTALYENSDDEVVREQAKNSVLHITILELLDKAVALYRERFGVYPKTTNDILRVGILREIPTDPFGFTFSVSDEGKIVPVFPQSGA